MSRCNVVAESEEVKSCIFNSALFKKREIAQRNCPKLVKWFKNLTSYIWRYLLNYSVKYKLNKWIESVMFIVIDLRGSFGKTIAIVKIN